MGADALGFGEPSRHIDAGLEGQGERADTGDAHEAPAQGIVTHSIQHHAVKAIELFDQGGTRLEHRRHHQTEGGTIDGQLQHAGFEPTPAHLAELCRILGDGVDQAAL
jgi:hypothetical protein